MIEAHHFSFKYPSVDRFVFQGLNLKIGRGESVLITGPSGCGKSTLGLCVSGLALQRIPSIWEGGFFVDGLAADQTPLPVLTQKVGMVFQNPWAQCVAPTVEEEIAFGLENRCVAPAEIERRITQALIDVDLVHKRFASTDFLSGGELQRLALASALAADTPVLVLDEPTAFLDPAGAEAFWALVAKIKQTRLKTLVLIEHRVDLVTAWVDRVVALDKTGKVVIDASPTEAFGVHLPVYMDLGIFIPETVRLQHAMKECGFLFSTTCLTVLDLIEACKQNKNMCLLDDMAPQQQQPRIEPMPSVSAAIEVRALSYASEGVSILHDLSFSVPQGSMVALLGANGAGKTTLARQLIGDIHPSSGSVWLDGQNLTHFSLRALSKRIGYVFQCPEQQFVADTVEHELRIGLELQRLPEDVITQRVEQTMIQCGLLSLREQHPFLLSQGQQRRLSVASMVLLGQGILVLDEPTFGQDDQYVQEFVRLIRDVKHPSMTVVLISHDMDLVCELADHVLVLHEGQLLFQGTPSGFFADAQRVHKAGLRQPVVTQLWQEWIRTSPENKPIAPILTQQAWLSRLGGKGGAK